MTAREELAAVPTRHQVNDFARVLMGQWEIVEGKPVSASYVATFADMARALLASPALARVIREAKAEAWEQGAFAGERNQREVMRIAHWSHIGKATPDPIRNPYRDQTEEPT